METNERRWWRSRWTQWGGPILIGLVVEGGGRLLFETGWITPAASALVDLFFLKVQTSVFNLLVGAALVGAAVWSLAVRQLAPNPTPLNKTAYTRDLIEDLLWEWDWHIDEIRNLNPICASCGARLREMRSPVFWAGNVDFEFEGFACDTCDESWELDGHPAAAVKREIRRRVRTGEWRDVVELFGSRSDPLDVPVET